MKTPISIRIMSGFRLQTQAGEIQISVDDSLLSATLKYKGGKQLRLLPTIEVVEV